MEDEAEQDKKPERDGPRGTSSEVMRIIVMVMMMVIMTVAGDNDDELIMNVNVMDQGNGGRSSIVEKMPILLTSVTIEMVLVRIRY